MPKDLTSQEKNIVNYHRNTIKSGNVGRDEEGRPVTVYSTGVKMESGPHKGKFASVPGYIDGKIRDEDREKASIRFVPRNLFYAR